MSTQIYYIWITTTSGNSTGYSTSSNTRHVSRTEQRSDPVKRKKPLGVERLFAGTSVSSSRTWNVPGIAQSTYTSPDGSYSSWSQQSFDGNGSPPRAVNFDRSYGTWSTKLQVKIKDASLNLAQAFAERKQTERMFVDFGQRVVNSYRALRKGRPHDVYSALAKGKKLPRNWKNGFKLDTLNRASDNWLAWQYGVRPLVQDLAGSVSEYLRARGVKPLIRSYRVSSEQEDYQVSTSGLGQNQISQVNTSRLEHRVVAWVEYNADDSQFLTTANRLGLTNPALLLWELIPYSFVIDWFVNVGDYLTASERIANLKRVGISDTAIETMQCSRSWGGGTATYLRKDKARAFMTFLPKPVLGWKKGINSWERVASSLALLRARSQSSNYPSKR